MKKTTEQGKKISQQIADCYTAKKRIIDALTRGERLTFLDGARFGASEFHTQICSIRKDVEDGKIPYRLCQTQYEFKEGKYCQIYWFERIKGRRYAK